MAGCLRLVSPLEEGQFCYLSRTLWSKFDSEQALPQHAITRIGALWEKHGNSGVVWACTPTARQLEKWQPVVYFSGKTVVLGLWLVFWRAVVLEGGLGTKPPPPSLRPR